MCPQVATCQGGLVTRVDPEGIGAEIGIEPGDRLIAINGHCLRDIIDYRFYGAEEYLHLCIEQDGKRQNVEIERGYDEELGLEFADPLFDGMRQCDNRCTFCFVNQMPPRSRYPLRRTLYLRDDDYRLSFLLGNFCTLTNLTEGDWQRIAEQRLSPLYVSIHATDMTVRRHLLGHADAPNVLRQLERLQAAGIRVHGQIVIVPGVNDGQVLRQSISDLLPFWPCLETLALVPVGLTRFARSGLSPVSDEESRVILDLAHSFRAEIRRLTSSTWLLASDEMYLLAGSPVPDAEHYDNGAQLENGVGLVRVLCDDWCGAKSTLSPGPGWPERVSLVCGTLIAPILTRMGAQLAAQTGMRVHVLPVANRFFGETVTVSGLLTAEDVLSALTGQLDGQHVFLPRAMFDESGSVTLDDVSLEEIARALGASVYAAGCMSEVVGILGNRQAS